MGNAADDRLVERSRPAEQLDIEFPQYLMVVDGAMEFMTLQKAGVTLDSGWHEVKIQGLVLEPGLKVRKITPEEESRMSEIADAYSASK